MECFALKYRLFYNLKLDVTNMTDNSAENTSVFKQIIIYRTNIEIKQTLKVTYNKQM